MPYAEINGVRTRYEHSEGGEQAIVFVHGLGMDHRTWKPQFSEFGDEYELLAYDVRGQGGGTEMGDPSNLSVQTLTEDLRALIEELDIEQPILCGHSYGGLIIGEYARQYPDEVAGLVYAEANTNIGDQFVFKLYANLILLTGTVEKLAGDKRMTFDLGVWDKVNRWLHDVDDDFDYGEITVDELDMTIEDYVHDTREDFLRHDEYKFISTASDDFDGVDLQDVDIPLLCMYGEEGSKMYEQMAKELEGEPGVVTDEIDGVAHFVSLGNSTSFNSSLREFVEDITAEPAQNTVTD